MKNRFNVKVENLITEGIAFNFHNNKALSDGIYYSRASQQFMTWVAKVEGIIRHNYNKESGPYSVLMTVNKQHFNGYDHADFEEEVSKLRSALTSCLSLKPNLSNGDNKILSLIKNPLFYTVIAILVGAAYKLGYDNGIAKYDNEKVEMRKTIDSLSRKDRANIITKVDTVIIYKDSKPKAITSTNKQTVKDGDILNNNNQKGGVFAKDAVINNH